MSVFFILALIFSLAFSFVFAVPLAGSLIRFRANYTPKVCVMLLRSSYSSDFDGVDNRVYN